MRDALLEDTFDVAPVVEVRFGIPVDSGSGIFMINATFYTHL